MNIHNNDFISLESIKVFSNIVDKTFNFTSENDPIYIGWIKPKYITDEDAKIIMSILNSKLESKEKEISYFNEEDIYTLIISKLQKEKEIQRKRK